MKEDEESAARTENLKVASFSVHATRGLVRDQGVRRKLMFAALGIAVAMAGLGSTLLQDFLNPRVHPVWCILFWLACAWMTVLAVLLALFDLLMVRAEAKAARRALGGNIAPKPGEP